MHPLLQKDIADFVRQCPYSDALAGSTFLITGATGLIGSMLVHCLLALDRGIRIIAPVRDIQKAHTLFDTSELPYIDLRSEAFRSPSVSSFVGPAVSSFVGPAVSSFVGPAVSSPTYIIHCAAPTSSRYFVEHPVETSTFIYDSTKELLAYAREHAVKGFLFLSSLEVYGKIADAINPVREDMIGYTDPLSPRSSYPMAKLAAENLCCLYAHQYGVPAKIARLTQTTGVGVSPDDNRVINQFARLAAQGKDIILHTRGESARPYCYLLDAIEAILTILLRGQSAEAYNVANESTYISARQMAEFLRDNFAPNIQIRVELDETQGYAPESRLPLSSQKLSQLGWQPKYGLKAIFDRLIPWLSAHHEC